MKTKITATIFLMLFIPITAFAVEIGTFPGLKQLIEKADAIVILRIDEHIKYQSDPTLYTTHACYIYQSLKGDIPKNIQIALQLMDTRTSFITPFSLYSTHLMFLTKRRLGSEPTDYRTIEFEGANIRLSPFGNEILPEGKALESKIKSLIRQSIKHWDKEGKKEKKFLRSIIE